MEEYVKEALRHEFLRVESLTALEFFFLASKKMEDFVLASFTMELPSSHLSAVVTLGVKMSQNLSRLPWISNGATWFIDAPPESALSNNACYRSIQATSEMYSNLKEKKKA